MSKRQMLIDSAVVTALVRADIIGQSMGEPLDINHVLHCRDCLNGVHGMVSDLWPRLLAITTSPPENVIKFRVRTHDH